MPATPSAEDTDLSDDALWKLEVVLRVFPVSRSEWFAGVKAGRYPAPVKLSKKLRAYRPRDIRALIRSY